VEEQDLHNFPNLAAFFYRTLKPGLRPIDQSANTIVSPADGKIIQFGLIEHGEVEQVKGMTYSLDALLGKQSPSTSGSTTPLETPSTPFPPDTPYPEEGKQDTIEAHEEFAQVNGITYTLPNLLTGKGRKDSIPQEPSDQSTTPTSSSEAEVRADLALSNSWFRPHDSKASSALHYCVIYLAPGDYHRFHSPVPWVVERRRHFAGELYSVSPYLQSTLPGLFTLNERVVLLGRWRWGFFSYTPVGATNVGSIVINFDKELRTNSLTMDTLADRAAEAAAARGEQWVGYAEATYDHASDLLGGYPLRKGEEMGGFQLGSTIVLVFEAPRGRRVTTLDQGYFGDTSWAGWNWDIKKGQKVKVGQALGRVVETE
jgi:phosphatidylserine decarboxylase